MGLDLYAGTLTRYYANNWKSAARQWAEANGLSFSRITPDGEIIAEEEVSADEVQCAVEEWRDQILAAVTAPGKKPYAAWQEDNEKPYYTDKPDWDAFGALLLVAACYFYGEPIPETVSKGWDFEEHPLIKRLSQEPENIWSLFCDTIMWLPLPDSFLFHAPRPTGDQATIATTAALRLELERLNELAWHADENTVRDWIKSEGYPVEGVIGEDGKFSQTELPEQTEYNTESLAKYAFSIFYQSLQFAEENQVPILMDF